MTILRLGQILSLPRPEYAKQAEIIAVDMLWRSSGTEAGRQELLRNLDDLPTEQGAACRRLVVRRRGGRKAGLVTETEGWALGIPAPGVFADVRSRDLVVAALLNSARAPTSSSDRSITCSPLHAGLVPFQTIYGAVNKSSPADMSKVVETVARLGGATEAGAAGALLAKSISSPQDAGHWLDGAFEALGVEAWSKVAAALSTCADLSSLPSEFCTLDPSAAAATDPTAYQNTPFGWFWRNWTQLLAPSGEWRSSLPDRRFMDWAITILRSGLAMAYVWEAYFLRRLQDVANASRENAGPTVAALAKMFHSPTLLRAESRSVPLRDKDRAAWLASHLASSYEIRRRARAAAKNVPDVDLKGPAEAVWEALRPIASMESMAQDEADDDPEGNSGRHVHALTATNTTREFVRYLLQGRRVSSADADEADLYYLARSSGSRFWIEPGPEWLVVATSLAAGGPGRETTLGSLRRGLADLGLTVDRPTLVGLLEEAGLTQDSPDADDALVVAPAFGGV